MKTVTNRQVEEMVMLVASGDLDLGITKNIFRRICGRATTANDDQLLIAHAATTDDDDAELCRNIILIEKQQITVVDAPAPATA